MAKQNQYFDAYSGVTLQLSDQMVSTLEAQLADKTAIFNAVARINKATLTGILNTPRQLPDRIRGRLMAPGARVGARLRIEVEAPSGRDGVWITPTGLTDAGGAFDIDLPSAGLPQDGIDLVIHGGRGQSLRMTIPRAELLGDGELGIVVMARGLPPLPMSVFGTLASYVPNVPDDVDTNPDAWADLQPGITLGEGDCAARIDPDGRAFDQFSYGLLHRLVDPEIWPKILRIENPNGQDFTISLRQLAKLPDFVRQFILNLGEISFGEREPITQPISVDDFATSISRAPLEYPKAGTLGIGYVLGMRQSWEPTGFSLGDLIYSLPLAPGEVQRLAVRERRETLATYDRESLSVNERRAFDEAVASSANSVFSSSLRESGSGGTKWWEEADASNVGGGFSLLGFSFGGGGGWSSSAGGGSGWSSASRNFVSSAVDQFNGSVSRQSATARQAARTSMRLASSSDTSETTTRVIANNNRLHALTVQYWEVLRHFSVTTRPDDVTLVAFVPLQLIKWRPARVPQTLNYSSDNVPTASALRRRYAMLWRYADRIWRYMPRRSYVHGMRQLRRLMTTPDISVSIAAGVQQAKIDVAIKGSFLPFDVVTVDAIDRFGRRIGRARLSPTGATPDFGAAIDRAAIVNALLQHRAEKADSHQRSGTMILRRGVDLSRVERFDVRTRLTSYTHTPDPEKLKLNLLFSSIEMPITVEDPTNSGASGSFADYFTVRPITLGAGSLRREVGGPKVSELTVFEAGANSANTDNLVDPSKVIDAVLPPWLPLPAKPVSPVLTDEQLVQIELLFQHVVNNPIRYSRGVWSGLDADERATMLEAYTIGVPPDSAAPADVSQEIPLLNCVTNRLMGFFGNSMILPFHLPPELERAGNATADRGVTTRDIQEALLQFHRQGFRPSSFSVTMPTDGHLAEAVLGQCASGEKIDLTRFWNWQDGAPTEVRSVGLPTQPGTELIGPAGAQTPGVTPPLAAPAITEGFVPKDPQSPEAILEAALTAKIPWLQTKLEDVRGMEALTALTEAALAKGDKPGVDVAAVNALNKAVTESAAKKGLKLTDLTKQAEADAKEMKDARTAAKTAEEAKTKEAEAAKKAEADKAKAAETARTDKIKTLVTDAAGFAALLQATPAAQRANAAAAIVTELVGDDPAVLSAVQKAELYQAYAPKTGGDAKNEDGKTAMRTALSLPT